MSMKHTLLNTAVGFGLVASLASAAAAEELTIATVNNGDMIRMQGLTADFTEKTGHTVEWVTLGRVGHT